MNRSSVIINNDRLKTEETFEAEMLEKARKVFPKGYVDALIKKGGDFLETESTGAWFSDSYGKKYLDAYTSAGMFNLGRNNPEISRELDLASKETDQGNFVVISEEKAALAERLADFMPDTLSCFLFTVVRGEAMDAACKLARGYTERQRLITVDGGSYGDTGFALSLSDCSVKDNFGTLIPGIDRIPFNDIMSAKSTIDKSCAAVILEPVQVENGCRMADKQWLEELRRICDATGTLLVFDETQTGFGRTGHRFASELYGVQPDILIFGEALTSGIFPMTGIAFTKKVKSFFDLHPLIHLCTFGGHDVGCRVAVSALDQYDRTEPWENARITGKMLLKHLSAITDNNPLISSVSGTGLLISIRFITEKDAVNFCLEAKEEGLIVMQGKNAAESVLLRPVLTLSDKEAGYMISAITSALKKL